MIRERPQNEFSNEFVKRQVNDKSKWTNASTHILPKQPLHASAAPCILRTSPDNNIPS